MSLYIYFIHLHIVFECTKNNYKIVFNNVCGVYFYKTSINMIDEKRHLFKFTRNSPEKKPQVRYMYSN